MLGFFFRHYDRFVQRYIVFDDGSTDGSLDLLLAHPKVEMRRMPEYSDVSSRIASNLSVLETCWQESRGTADWVIVTDIDEHLHHRELASYLADCQSDGVTIVPALGFQMLSEEPPEAGLLLCEKLTMGAPWSMMNKMNIFSPDGIEAANFAPGRHTASPTGRVIAPRRDELLLLHYKYLGFDRTMRRHAEYQTRQRAKDIAMRWGQKYAWSADQLRDDWNQFAARLVDVSDPHLSLQRTHAESRWWDGYRRATVS